MNWIRIATKMKNDPRIGAIAAACKVRVHEVVGLVTCTLLEFPEHARDGDITAIGDLTIEQWALWPGKAGVFAQAFRQHLCDPSAPNVVRSWERHNGAALRKAESDIERKRSGRRTDTDKTARERRADGARRARGRLQVGDALSEVDETLRRTTTATAAAAAVVVPGGGGGGGEATAALRVQFTEPHHRDAFDGYLRAHQFPTAMLSEVSLMAEGAHAPGGQPVPWPVLGRALHEMRAAGIARFSSGVLLSFVRPLLAGAEAGVDSGPSFTDLIARAERGELLPNGA